MLFKPAQTTSAYLKEGIMGFAGSGKTYTATETAIGLIAHMRKLEIPGAAKPMYFLDTETGSDWVKPQIEKAKIELFTAKTRAFTDLLAATKEAQQNASLLLVDSVTHFWMELCETYRRRKGEQKKTANYRLQFQDWAYLKGQWGQFTDWFINSPVHVIICGRAGYEYDYFEDDDGKKQLEKTGIKMKAETEMGFEPSLLVLMERHIDMETKKAYRVATILKDRSTAIDGKQIQDPKFKDFMPHIEHLNLGGVQLGVDTTRTSEGIVPAEDRRDHGPVQRRIVVDEIQTLLTFHIPGQAAADKKRKIELLRKHFNKSWTEIEEVMPLFDLRAGYDALHRELEDAPSRYSRQEQPTEAPPEINDSLPDHSAPPAAEPPDDPTDPGPIPDVLRVGNGKGKAKAADADLEWLASLERVFAPCSELADLFDTQAKHMAPKKSTVSTASWKAAERLISSHIARVGQTILDAG